MNDLCELLCPPSMLYCEALISSVSSPSPSFFISILMCLKPWIAAATEWIWKDIEEYKSLAMSIFFLTRLRLGSGLSLLPVWMMAWTTQDRARVLSSHLKLADRGKHGYRTHYNDRSGMRLGQTQPPPPGGFGGGNARRSLLTDGWLDWLYAVDRNELSSACYHCDCRGDSAQHTLAVCPVWAT